MQPTLIKGNLYQDERGTVRFNNDFVALGIKRMYTLENVNITFVRAWQGHKIEQRWFSPIMGSFKIKLIEVNNWSEPSKDLPMLEFILKTESLDVLHVPPGYISSIQAIEEHSKLLVLSDYELGEIQDEYRFSADYFKI
jgi:hypothetical protein